jgi:hypothetical protein
VLLLVGLAAAFPDDEVARAAARRVVLDDGLDAFAGLAAESDTRAAFSLGDCARGGPWAEALLGAACERDVTRLQPRSELRPMAALTVGDAEAVNAAGEEGGGLFGARVGLRGAVYTGPMVARLRGSVGIDTAPAVLPTVQLPEAWIGYDTGKHWLGLGQQSRWMGPGQQGTLLLSDNATPPWMVNGGLDGHLPGVLGKAGRFRAELGVGVLPAERDDVQLPGLLLMDLRWMPHPVFELGVNRLSIFGGEGRPDVDLGQLLVPSEPHVYDDPDKVLPDQDELASMTFRANLPLHRWFGGPFGHLSGWWEYGGEDLVIRQVGTLDYPSLAGVANLYGGELAIGPVVATAEYALLMDDAFRWYIGHRVYHDGFTQDGRVMGHFGGPDSEVAAGSLSVWGESWRLRASAASVRRVAVVEMQNGTVVTLRNEESELRGGLAADVLVRGAWLTAGYTAVAITNENFVPGDDGLEHRVTVALSAGPELFRR